MKLANVVQVVIRAHDFTRDAFHGVARNARSLATNLVQGITSAFGKLADVLPDAIGGPLKSALSTPYVGPIVVGAVTAIAATIGPIIGALIASAITLGLGAALVGVGAMIVLKNKNVKEKLSKDFKDVGQTMEKAFKPLIPVVEHVGDVAKKVAKTFEPVINQSMKLAQPHLKKFIDQLGKSVEQLAPAIGPLMDAFTKILDELGPKLPDMVTKISNALIKMFDAVGKHPEVITKTFELLIDVVVGTIVVLGWLTDAVGYVEKSWGDMKNAFSTTWDAMGEVWGNLKNALSDVGGWFSGIWDSISSGASGAIGWVSRLGGRIKGLAGKTVKIAQSGASGAMHAVSSLIGTIRRFVGKVVRIGQSGAAGAMGAVQALINTIRRFVGKIVRVGESGAAAAMGRVAGLINTIRRLFGKLVRVGANVFGLDAVWGLVNAIRNVVSKTVSVGAHLFGFAHGGVVGAAGGGPRSNMVMVGEQGRELVRLPAGSTVIPHGQTESMMAAGGGTLKIELEWVGGGTDEFRNFLKKTVRAYAGRGPDSVQQAFGG